MPAQARRTRWGGIADGRFQPSGFFRVGHSHRTFWLVDPDGGRFLSKGVNTVQFKQDKIRDSERIPYAEACLKKYGSENAWRTAAAKRLAGWGFNTLGSWSDEAVAAAGPSPLATTPNLNLGMSFAWQHNERNRSAPQQQFPDVFDPAFEHHVRQRARDLCAKHSGERRILGWFIDNELRWGPDWRGPEQLLPLFLNLSEVSPGRVAALGWLRERGADGPTPSAADYEAFAGLVADRYFALTTAAIKEVDPNHLVLGCRFAFPPPKTVIETAGRHLDVISFNCYEPDANALIDAYAGTGKPCLIGEFSFRAADSGLPNTNGAGPQVATQGERAAGFRHYVTMALKKRTLVGYHWFEHADQPAEGRFDGENSNFGTVTIDDRVYEDLTCSMTAVNAAAEELHAEVAEAAT
jgi:hypothetical protein